MHAPGESNGRVINLAILNFRESDPLQGLFLAGGLGLKSPWVPNVPGA